jgi:plastocyanin
VEHNPTEEYRRIALEIRLLRSCLAQLKRTVDLLEATTKNIAVAIGLGATAEPEDEISYVIKGKPCVLDPAVFSVTKGKTVTITNETGDPVTVTFGSGLFVFEEGQGQQNPMGEVEIELAAGESITLQVPEEPSAAMGYYKLSCSKDPIGGGGSPKEIHVNPPGS